MLPNLCCPQGPSYKLKCVPLSQSPWTPLPTLFFSLSPVFSACRRVWEVGTTATFVMAARSGNHELLGAAVVVATCLLVRDATAQVAAKRQPVFVRPFPCNTDVRSSRRPDSVHRLRPGDIDVVGAMGDSLVAGNGALEDFALGALIEHRGVSWCAGGRGSWKQFLTLPNILREFNPRLVGYSTWGNSHLNVAFPVSAGRDTLAQARLLVSRMTRDPRVDFRDDWKMVTLMIGANDLCSVQCYSRGGTTAAHHQRELRDALDHLHEHLPRAFVNLVPVIDVSVSVRVKRTPMCRLLHTLFCACFHQSGGEFDVITQLVQEYQAAAFDLVSSGRYDTKEDFTVVVQPFIRFLNAPQDGSLGEAIHESYVTHDCFHFSQKGHAMAANMLWNNLLEPEWNKSQTMPHRILEHFHCPTEHTPYLFTSRNSRTFLFTGRQT